MILIHLLLLQVNTSKYIEKKSIEICIENLYWISNKMKVDQFVNVLE